jgi:hypothetical protein
MNLYFLKCKVEKHPTHLMERIVRFKAVSGKYHSVVVLNDFVGRNKVIVQLVGRNRKKSLVMLPFSTATVGQDAKTLYRGFVPSDRVSCVKV